MSTSKRVQRHAKEARKDSPPPEENKTKRGLVAHKTLEGGGTRGQLSEKQKLFIHHYLICNNKTEAYVKAGYSPKNAHQNVQKLYNAPLVRQEIEARRAQVMEKLEITQERVLQRLADIAFDDYDVDVTKILKFEGQNVWIRNMDEIPEKYRRGILEVKQVIGQDGERGIAIKMRDRKEVLAALHLLGKHLGTWEKQNGQEANPSSRTDVINRIWDNIRQHAKLGR